MILVVGLGNPGREYRLSKHNLGFMVLEQLAKRIGTNLDKKGFSGIYGVGEVEERKLLLLKPETYMNRSGISVSGAVNFFKISTNDIIAVYDEMDLPLGSLKVKVGGGSAGHKGVESIMNNLGSDNFIRVRIGIGKPPQKSESVSHVLSRFKKEEQNVIEDSVNRATDAVLEIITNGADSAMNKFNQRPESSASLGEVNTK